jgi:hypothetical protein
MMAEGIVSPRTEGTPQGGPLSPLLSNILLTELDWELERRGHAFCRYADDCNIYVRSQTAGERVMASITRFLLDTLKLTVNAAKSAVARPWTRKFLGYSLTWHKAPRLRIAPTSLQRLEDKIREVLKGARGRSLSYTIAELNPVLRGWAAYFKLTETKMALEELDGWIRHKLRCILWRQWKRPYTRARNLMKAGLVEERAFRSAFNQRGPWWNSGASHMNQAFPKSSLIVQVWCRCSIRRDDSRVFNEPPDAEPHVRWCERTTGVTPSPTRSMRARYCLLYASAKASRSDCASRVQTMQWSN